MTTSGTSAASAAAEQGSSKMTTTLDLGPTPRHSHDHDRRRSSVACRSGGCRAGAVLRGDGERVLGGPAHLRRQRRRAGHVAGADDPRLRGPGHRGRRPDGQAAVPRRMPRRHVFWLGRPGHLRLDRQHVRPQERRRQRIWIARDNLGGHQVSLEASWTGSGPLETTVNTAGSKRKQRTATAVGSVTFDGVVLVDSPGQPSRGRRRSSASARK